MNPFSTLPTEITHLIVSSVPHTSLRALSLTSPHFTEPCQRRLFSALKLEARLAANQHEGIWASYRGALAHFSAHPRLATYVTHLKIYLRKPWKPYPWSDVGEGDLAALESVFDLLERLDVSVQRLKIRVPSRAEDWEDWMLTAVRRMMAHTLRNPTGHHMHLSMKAIDNIPIHDVYRALWANHSLALQDLYVSEPGQHPPVEAPAADAQLIGGPALRKLKIFGTNYLYDMLLQPSLRRYTNSITTLSIDGFGPPLVGITLDDRIEPPLAPHYNTLSPHFAELDAALLPYCTSTAAGAVQFGVQHHLFYEPETPEERKLDSEAHYAAFSDALCGPGAAGLARAFAVGLKLVRWGDAYEI